MEQGTDGILQYLHELEKEWEFDTNTWTLYTELKPIAEQELQKRLLGRETSERVSKLVKQIVEDELDIEE